MRKMVQRTGFEPAKHYALGPHPSPFDHSGTSAWSRSEPPSIYQNGEAYHGSKRTESPTLTVPSSTTLADHLDQPLSLS